MADPKGFMKVARQVADRRNPADRVKDWLKQQAIQKQLPEYFQKLRKQEPVEILDEKLKLADEDVLAPAKADINK